MKIIIAGAGRVGSVVAQSLEAEGHDITLIDRDVPMVICYKYRPEFNQVSELKVLGDVYGKDVVIFDDMALEPGRIRIRKEGSSGGHKGMQNIIDCLSTDKIKRIRIGIGEPGEWDTVDFVLSKPLKDEQPLIDEAIENAVGALKEAIKSDFDRAMNKFN